MLYINVKTYKIISLLLEYLMFSSGVCSLQGARTFYSSNFHLMISVTVILASTIHACICHQSVKVHTLGKTVLTIH